MKWALRGSSPSISPYTLARVCIYVRVVVRGQWIRRRRRRWRGLRFVYPALGYVGPGYIAPAERYATGSHVIVGHKRACYALVKRTPVLVPLSLFLLPSFAHASERAGAEARKIACFTIAAYRWCRCRACHRSRTVLCVYVCFESYRAKYMHARVAVVVSACIVWEKVESSDFSLDRSWVTRAPLDTADTA